MLQDGKIEAVLHNLKTQQRTALHMNQLIGDLTDVAKIQAGRLQIEPRECALREALEPSIERTRLLAKDRNVHFAAELTSEPFRISVDPGRITQILDNLFGNALKFTPPGGRISVEVEQVGKEVRVAVS